MGRPTNMNCIRLIVIGLVFATAFARSPAAQADAYHWGGEVDRLRADVHLLGFHEGAGVGGWELESARRFAAWARLANTFIPRGARVVVFRPIDADVLSLEFHSPEHISRLEMSIGDLQTDAEWGVLIGELRKHWPRSDQNPTTPPTLPTVFTVQLAATSSRDSARALVQKLAQRGLKVRHQFFYEACLPCTVSPARVITHKTNSGTVYRIIAGVFATRRKATRALKQIEKQLGLHAIVRSQ